ncbi:hypothetical protein GCM10022631_04800 [Deinococcus rubellus]|uniref:hypothetical protein n=1 Tax=Deinococcus rubellus TaxID=1889240 RepID=UPI0031EA0FF2
MSGQSNSTQEVPPALIPTNTTTYSHDPARLRALHEVLAEIVQALPPVPQPAPVKVQASR